MKIRLSVLMMIAVLAMSCKQADLTRYADPLIGTAYTGHTFPGAAYPFGNMQPSPHTGNFSWEHCSGYNNDDRTIWGFGQNHLNGTGCPDLGDLMMMPFSASSDPEYKSAWDRESVKACPGYYAVTLTDNQVDVQLTCTPHVAYHRYDYKGAERSLYVDFQTSQHGSREHNETHVLQAEINFESPYVITGHHHVKGWVTRHFYYVIEFDQPVVEKTLVQSDPRNVAPKYVFTFPDEVSQVNVKVAMSTVSIDEARANAQAEIPHWDFEQVRNDASIEWNKYLSMIDVDGTEDQKTNFYTSFYHLLIQPNNIADVSGLYRGADDKVCMSKNGKYYSTFSLWDTFRAAHPFYALMLPEVNAAMVNNMLDHADAQGYLPIWTLWGKENFCMIGNHAVPVVVDACMKGLPGIDHERAFAAIRKSLTENHWLTFWDEYDKYEYYPFDLTGHESVSRTLECGYDDWCAAVLAKSLGLEDDYQFFLKRSGYWKNLFDKTTGLMRARDSKGNWRTPFDQFMNSHAGTWGGDYTEGNAWQYTWHVMHDPEGLAEMMGGKEAFVTKLDSLFVVDTRSESHGFSNDVTGLIGQYAHGNEPSHHVVYLYSRLGYPEKTQTLVREIFDRFYQPRPDGLCGNDDCGQMSAWYMFSALGFYPMDSVSGEYVFGAPQMPYFKLSLPNGKKLEIIAENYSPENKYVEEITFNGELQGNVIAYDVLKEGGVLIYKMKDK